MRDPQCIMRHILVGSVFLQTALHSGSYTTSVYSMKSQHEVRQPGVKHGFACLMKSETLLKPQASFHRRSELHNACLKLKLSQIETTNPRKTGHGYCAEWLCQHSMVMEILKLTDHVHSHPQTTHMLLNVFKHVLTT